MTRPATASVCVMCLCGLALGQSTAGSGKSQVRDQSAAYYNFAMGHLYGELAGAYGNRAEYVNKAVEHYKLALKLDPSSRFLLEELADLYIQAGRLRDAVSEAEDLLRQNPENLEARRVLGRIYVRLIGDPQTGKVHEEMLRKSIEQYQKIAEKDPKDLESWLTLGKLHRTSNNSVEAEKAYRQAVDLDPSNEEALTGLAVVYSDVGDTKKSIEMLHLVTERTPSSRTLAALAASYEQMKDYAKAVEVWRKGLELEPDNGRLRRGLAQALLFSDHPEEALKLYLQIAKEDPRDVQAQLRLAEIYRQRRQFSEARAALEKAKELDKDSLEVRYDEVNLLEAEGKVDEAVGMLKAILNETAKKNYTAAEKNNRSMLLERLGILERSAGQHREAIETFRQIAELFPENAPRVAGQIVETYRLAKNLTKAREEADAALKKYPNDRVVKVVHASLLADMGQIDESVAEMQALLKGDKDRETHLAIAQIYEKGKRFAEMEKELQAAEKLSESKQEKEAVYFMRGAMYEKAKKYDASEAEFRKVLESNPENASALNYLGYMLADRNIRLEEAQKLISRALELDPQNGAYLDSMAWVYYRLNRLSEAENLLIRALERIGKDPTVHDHLGDVYWKQGKIREAIGQWQSSLKATEAPGSHSDVDAADVAKIRAKLENARVRLAKETSATANKQ